MTKPKLIYICGMGHNGSTILNLALNLAPQVVATSQLNDLLNPYDPYEESENSRTKVDEFWIDVLEQLTPEERDQLQSANGANARERDLLKSLMSGKHRKRLADINAKLAGIVIEKTGASVLVDSSKNVSRALSLSACEDIDVYHVHLIRDVRGLVNSNNKRNAEQSRPNSYLNSTVHWLIKNVTASLFLPVRAKKRLKIYYEDLVLSADNEMDRLEAFLGESLPETREAIAGRADIDSESLGFGGNRVLNNKKNMRFRTGELPTDGAYASGLYWYTLGWPAVFWGYRRKQKTGRQIKQD